MKQGLRDVDQLIDMIAKLPGLGPRSAQRVALYLIQKCSETMEPMMRLMQKISQDIQPCQDCGNLGEGPVCHICLDGTRKQGQICVVDDISDLWAMERAMAYKGQYHVLGGTLSALDSIGPDELRIPALLSRLKRDQISEVILALGTTVDGQTTAHYIADQITPPVIVTRLAQGVPIGGELEYLDDGTITAAFGARKAL